MLVVVVHLEKHYNIIKNESVFEETEKRSKFISYSFKVENESSAKEKLKAIKSLHHSAKHHVYAYSLLSCEKSSDDGEPSGTAGVPILSVIKNNNLKNVIVIIVRYFGGILLGTPGLRRMYSSGAENVIKNSGIVKLGVCSNIVVSCGYKDIGNILNTVSEFKGKINKIDYLDIVVIKFYVQKNYEFEIIKKLENIIRNKENIKVLSESYHEVDV